MMTEGLLVVSGLGRLAGLLGGGGRVVGGRGQCDVRRRREHEARHRAGGLDVEGVQHELRHNEDVVAADAGSAEINGAARCDQGDIAPGRILAGQRDQGGDAGTGDQTLRVDVAIASAWTSPMIVAVT